MVAFTTPCFENDDNDIFGAECVFKATVACVYNARPLLLTDMIFVALTVGET